MFFWSLKGFLFHVKQSDFLKFFPKELPSLLAKGSSFRLEGFPPSLFPLIYPLFSHRVLVFYTGFDVESSLSLFLDSEGVFYDSSFASGKTSPAGFSGVGTESRRTFLSSLKERFKNNSVVFFPYELRDSPIFKRYDFLEGFSVKKGVSYNSLLSCLLGLDYSSCEYVGSSGEFAARGMVVDFFPHSSLWGFRAVFEGGFCSSLFKFDPKTQLVVSEVGFFDLIKSQSVEKNVSLQFFINEEDFLILCMDPDGVSFSGGSPPVIKSSLSELPLQACLDKKSVQYVDFLGLTGFGFKGQCFVPGWMKKKNNLKGLSLDAYVDFSTVERGDFVVHSDFGVGRYLGLFADPGGEKMVIGYGSSKVSVFPNYFNKVSFYAKKTSNSQEDVLGSGGAWKRRVSSVKKNVSLIAENLVSSFLERKKVVSDTYYLDSDLEQSFLRGFAFQDTEDQALVWGEVKQDLLSSSPMDRLVCGDVGFGKTEVAMRAAFVSSFNGFGVVILAPTTILAKQLYLSFKKRLGDYGVSVGFVSRLVSVKDQKITIDSFLSGNLGVVVGTHKLLFNTDVLKKASLIVVDDEHKFGVKQKERVKNVNPRVNMLYMSATPIPRTLKLALSKITSISTISSPPISKLPTKTFVDFFSKKIITSAVLKEVSRGGQVFFIHNKVQTMPSIVSFLKNLFPNLSVESLHGQEPPKTIEEKMDAFLKGKVDVLVASSIVENGVDIPSVNTIIINNAHLFGISQLYQMRGRVGRGSLPSFAYLLVPKNKPLAGPSKNRLKIIEKNSALGSCYAVSMEDLNLRGGGTLFGYQQSGSVSKVGLEVYNRFLEEAINKASNKRNVLCSVSSSLVCSIPSDYLPSPKMRAWLYKEVSLTASVEDLVFLVKKTSSLFGPIPLFLKNLICFREIEILGGYCFFKKIIISDDFVDVFICSVFWEKRMGLLINLLNDYKFVLRDGGKVFKLYCDFRKLNVLLVKIHKGLGDD